MLQLSSPIKCDASMSSMLKTLQTILLLSDLSPSVRRVKLLARVARVWEFFKDNLFMHLDIVFVDEKVDFTCVTFFISR